MRKLITKLAGALGLQPGMLTDATKNAMLDSITMNEASLHTAYSSTGANEVAGGSPAYARKAITMGAAAAAVRSSSTQPVFDVPASTTVRWIGLWTSGGAFRGMYANGGSEKGFQVDLTNNRILCENHGLANDDKVVFYGGTPPTGPDQTAVTLAATQKALYPAQAFPALGARYFDMIGKKLRIRAFGKITTAATPGNITWGVFWGTGADANGTSLGTSAAQALVANQTNLSWEVCLHVHCRALGSTGSLYLTGWAMLAEGVSVAHMLIPNSAAAAVTVDLTANNVISLQAQRSGSTAESMTCQDLDVTALN